MLRLFDPTQQFQDRSGALLVGGSVTVYLDGTDDLAEVYNDEQRAMQQPVPIDSDGRVAGLFVKDDKTYWMKVKDPSGNTLFTITDMTPSSNPGSIDKLLEKFVRVDASQPFTAAEKAKGRENLGIDQVLNNYVRVDAAQEFDDEKLKQGRDNIKAQKDIGGPGAFIDTESVDSTNVWAQIGELDLDALGISLANSYSNISLSLEFTVYNTGTTDGAIVERGRFDINVHVDPSNSKWNYDAQWISYDSRVAGTHIIDSMRVSKKMNVSEIKTLTLHVKVPDPSIFKDNALNVSVLKNYGTIHRNDNMNTVKSFVKPWTLWICAVWQTFTLGINESPAPIGRYLSGNYDSYVDFPTVHAPQLLILDTPIYTQTDGDNAVKRGDLPIIVDQRFGEGATAFPIAITDSAQKFVSINTVRRMSVFNGGPSGNIEYRARLSSTGFMTPEIDTTTAGTYLVGEDYLYPTAGQTHSISVYFEVVDPGSSVYNVKATWRRSGTDDPKEFKIAVTYFGNTVGCWHGTKTLSTTETDLVVTDFENMVKIEIDFISTDGERWYHFEYFKNGNRSRMVEY